MPDSDLLYHRFFSDPYMVEGLVWEFAPREVAAGLDFRTLQRVNAKFHLGRRSARRREGDVIWRLPMREGSGVYLYVLIEFQSKSDHWMAVRTEVYQGLLWQQVIVEQRLRTGARVPPLLLLVLYNGERRWKAATEAKDLIELSSDSSLWPCSPSRATVYWISEVFPRTNWRGARAWWRCCFGSSSRVRRTDSRRLQIR
jgi:hypothetical protein